MNTKQMALLVVLSVVMLSVGWAAADSGNWQVYSNLSHEHATATHHSDQICGDHICKPGEKYNP